MVETLSQLIPQLHSVYTVHCHGGVVTDNYHSGMTDMSPQHSISHSLPIL